MGSIGNLGDYQRLSIAAKKVGGPANLGLLVSGVSAVIGAAAGIGFKTASDKRKTSKKKKELASAKYTVHTSATDNQGLSLNTGDRFKVLFIDRDVVLINVESRNDNPFYVSSEFLTNISDFNK